ncbi:MAG TPA: hypothetical protein VER36_03220 [Flavisolibacter sp.]|nr:hypothetical protein [Flavisolibacter sp.]
MQPVSSKGKISLFILFTFIHCYVKAQTTGSPVGEYYLQGVVETASGFVLKHDSTFQFFFSYGALDRFGEGRWSVKNDSVYFSSRPRPEHDFRLVRSEKAGSKKILIHLKEMSPALHRHVSCRISGGGAVQEGVLNEKGGIELTMQAVDSIELLFEFCPEKKSVFRISTRHHNRFEFAPHPWLMEVFFHNFHLRLTKDGMTGGHPLSSETKFRYEKKVR